MASAHVHDATMFVIFYDLCDYECKYSKEITLEDFALAYNHQAQFPSKTRCLVLQFNL